MFFSHSVESGVIYLFQHLGLLISHSPGSFFQDSAVGSLEEAGILHKPYCYQHNSHSYQMCKIKTTEGAQAEGASPAPSGHSQMCSQVGEGVRERRAPLNTRRTCLHKDFYILTKLGYFLVPPHLLSQHLYPRAFLPANLVLLKRPAC